MIVILLSSNRFYCNNMYETLNIREVDIKMKSILYKIMETANPVISLSRKTARELLRSLNY